MVTSQKTRSNLESKLRFSGNSFNFFQNSVIFCALCPIGTRQGPAPPTTPGAAASSSQGSKGSRKTPFQMIPSDHCQIRLAFSWKPMNGYF